mmetsp:Transcript_22241/g.50489  ORF Transcript_22241/g.50489 Transcript_22241/m.50489 type:complete len:108 (+) Transcript_22241:959-1282(+)
MRVSVSPCILSWGASPPVLAGADARILSSGDKGRPMLSSPLSEELPSSRREPEPLELGDRNRRAEAERGVLPPQFVWKQFTGAASLRTLMAATVAASDRQGRRMMAR